MTNVLTIITIAAIVTAAFGGLGFVFNDITSNNKILTNESILLMGEIANETNSNFAVENIEPSSSNLTANSTFEGTEDFSRQYREERSQITQLLDNLNTVKKVPGIVVKSFGIPITEQMALYLTVIGSLITIIISLAIFIAIKNGEVKNR